MSERKVVLIASDEKTRVVLDRGLAERMSQFLASTLAMDDDDDPVPEIPLPDCSAGSLLLVAEFLGGWDLYQIEAIPRKKVETADFSTLIKPVAVEGEAAEETKKFYVQFFGGLIANQDQFFALIRAANYLDIPTLLDSLMAFMATTFYGKRIEDIEKYWGLDPLTEEEELKARSEFSFVYEIAG